MVIDHYMLVERTGPMAVRASLTGWGPFKSPNPGIAFLNNQRAPLVGTGSEQAVVSAVFENSAKEVKRHMTVFLNKAGIYIAYPLTDQPVLGLRDLYPGTMESEEFPQETLIFARVRKDDPDRVLVHITDLARQMKIGFVFATQKRIADGDQWAAGEIDGPGVKTDALCLTSAGDYVIDLGIKALIKFPFKR